MNNERGVNLYLTDAQAEKLRSLAGRSGLDLGAVAARAIVEYWKYINTPGMRGYSWPMVVEPTRGLRVLIPYEIDKLLIRLSDTATEAVAWYLRSIHEVSA